MPDDQYTSQDPTRQYAQPDTEGEQIDYPGQTGAMGVSPTTAKPPTAAATGSPTARR